MVLVEQPQQHHFAMRDSDDFNSLYPEPPQGAFSSAPMDLPVESYHYQRPGQDLYPATTTMGYDGPIMFASEAPYMSPPQQLYQHDDTRVPSSNLSTTSVSAPSSAVGSPRSNHGQQQVPEWGPQGLGVSPGIVGQGEFFPGAEYGFSGHGHQQHMDDFPTFSEFAPQQKAGFVDPSILHPEHRPMGIYEQHAQYPPPPSHAYPGSPAMTNSPQMRPGSTSPYPPTYQTYGSPFQPPMDAHHVHAQGRRPSTFGGSVYSVEHHYSDGEAKEKTRCPHPDCGKTFKDLKAHMLTHQTERPEKCPIQTCDYHIKGFARKYDKNRHTLTHYKGTMVCGFCPGSGSAAEKSFNRADVFKRHLTAVHGVEQTAPNGRKKIGGGPGAAGKKPTGYAPDATGKCSTCSQTFSNAQDFYEHLDDCVLRIVQLEEPSEKVNAQRLAEVEDDREVHATLEKNNLPTTTITAAMEEDDDEEMEDDDSADEDYGRPGSSSKTNSPKKGLKGAGVSKSRGMTHSRGGVPVTGKRSGRKSRRDYPSSWGFDKGQMTMKKRVMAVFEGSRRLAKDDLMLSTDNEVRIKLADGRSYVTDLDVQTMKRAEGFLSATDEEKGAWISDDPTEAQIQEMEMLAAQQQ